MKSFKLHNVVSKCLYDRVYHYKFFYLAKPYSYNKYQLDYFLLDYLNENI